MTAAILDTNVVVQSLIGSPRSASLRTVRACVDGKFRPVYSSDTLDELMNVLLLPRMQKEHSLTDTELLEFIESLIAEGDRYSGTTEIAGETVRDLTDRKFVSLATESHADYLVTNDRRHLLPLKQIGETRIVTPTAFLRHLSE